ncbi:MAG: hypothetical protein ACTHN4_11115 [Sphingomicrobium sp.]
MTLEEVGQVPPLDELCEATKLTFEPGVGLNEVIIEAGFHPSDYGRNPFMADGSVCPPKALAA